MKFKNKLLSIILPILFHFLGNNVFSNLEIPDFNYILQRPSYILEESKNNYICDGDKDECKINFKLVDENEKDISSKYECEIITDFDILSNENRCNPTTITIPEYTNQKIKFKIYEKGNLDNFKEKEINIINIFEKKDLDFKYNLQSPSYVYKGGKDILNCDGDKDECKINLKFLTLEDKDISSKYDCEIKTDFEISNFNDNCNPTTILIPENTDQVIKIKLFEKNSPDNFIEKEIFVDNTITHYLPQTKIRVQGKDSKYKIIKYSSMKCLTYDKCRVNFTSGKSDSGTNYRWIFGNGEKYYGYNPKTQDFPPGFYKVKLFTSNKFGNKKIEIYRLNVKKLLKKTESKLLKNNLEKILKFKQTAFLEIDNEIKITKLFKKTKKDVVKKLELQNIKKQLTVKKVFGKPKKLRLAKIKKRKIDIKKNKSNNLKLLSLEKEKLLKKNIKLNILFQKKNLKISGKTFPESKVEIKIGEKLFLTSSDSDGKYSLKINTLKVGYYKILASVFDNKKELIAQKYSSEKEITKNYITQLNSYKNPKIKSKKKKSKKYIAKIKKFKIENNIKNTQYSSIIPFIKNEDKFSIKIFAINILITILSLILATFILIRKKII